jgi:cell division protein ZapB
LTPGSPAIYSDCVTSTGHLALEIKDLEAKIDELIQLCDELERKNASLSTDREGWEQEKARLLEKNEMARTKVEAMITRLKALEQE